MDTVNLALDHLSDQLKKMDNTEAVPFEVYLRLVADRPQFLMRNVFQVFHDMVATYVGQGFDEYPDDPESISYVCYDCNQLFVVGADHPFFADRLFANRLITHVEAMRSGAQQNKIYIFDGPPGCGKSTFLNNLLGKLEEYANTDDGLRYETVWRLDIERLSAAAPQRGTPFWDQLGRLVANAVREAAGPTPQGGDNQYGEQGGGPSPMLAAELNPVVEVPCPSHDNPLLMIPKRYRRTFFEKLYDGRQFKDRLLASKEYEWVFQDKPCTICSSIYQTLLDRLKDPREAYDMLAARPYRFNRRLGEGISIFSPGDRPLRQQVLNNPEIQRQLNGIAKNRRRIDYLYSRYAKTNNGVYALMDIKSHNTERLIELHNIISEGVHKVEDLEENVNSLLLAVMNPEDKQNIQDFRSFSDRIEYIKIPYVMDLKTEVEIYRNIFGAHIEKSFLPRVLHNFARVIVATRLKTRSEALLEWIGDPDKYRHYCDKNLQLLKMEIYSGYIPIWLREEDRKSFNAKRRRRIIDESEHEGEQGLSGRDSIKLFNEFYTAYSREGRLISMATLHNFFTRQRKDLKDLIPEGFLDSLIRMYNYSILQEIKESLYYYNEEQITRDIQNYLFAVNFELGATEINTYTGERLNISEDFLEMIEMRLLGSGTDDERRKSFRKETQKEYTSRTLTQEVLLEERPITETALYQALLERYIYNLKEKVLDPFLDNENFRRGIKDFGTEDFKTYDKRIRDDVTFLIENLRKKFRYTQLGAKEVCIYAIDSDLASQFAKS